MSRPVWGGKKAARKRNRPVQKPKIRWDVLGFEPRSDDDRIPSIDEIRRQVSSLASHGFGQETRLRSGAKETAVSPSSRGRTSVRPRRGATD